MTGISPHCRHTRIYRECGFDLYIHGHCCKTARIKHSVCGAFETSSFIPLACAKCDDSLLFSGASSITLCYIPFPSILFHQLVFHPPSIHLAIYFLVYLSASLSPNSYIILLGGILFSSILSTCPNQRNLFDLIVSVTVGFFNHCINFFIG